MNIELFRYLTLVQLVQNAITGAEISDKSELLTGNVRFFDANQMTNTFVLMRCYSC